MSNVAETAGAIGQARASSRRYTIVALFFLATTLCYVDRVSISVAIIPLAREKHYEAATQGIILSAFFWGYIWLQLPGGWMADRFGGKRVLATGVALWSVATFVTPAATVSLPLLLAARVMLGIGESVNFPSIHSLAARWMPPAERGRALGLNFSGMFLGTVAAFLASPAIIVTLGWRALFYISGALGAIWVIAWLAKAADRPEASASRFAAESSAILAAEEEARAVERVPWAKIVREKAVWAIVLAHFGHNWGFNILLLWLPTYLDRTFGVPMKRLGALSLTPWLVTFVASNLSGWVCDALCVRGFGTTAVRRSVQTVAFTLAALPLLVLPIATSPVSAIALVSVSAAANSLGLTAFGINHLDVAPRYAGILMGLSNTIATLPGIIGVAAAGYIWQATGSFAGVFYLTALVYLIGAAGYLRWATGERRI